MFEIGLDLQAEHLVREDRNGRQSLGVTVRSPALCVLALSLSSCWAVGSGCGAGACLPLKPHCFFHPETNQSWWAVQVRIRESSSLSCPTLPWFLTALQVPIIALIHCGSLHVLDTAEQRWIRHGPCPEKFTILGDSHAMQWVGVCCSSPLLLCLLCMTQPFCVASTPPGWERFFLSPLLRTEGHSIQGFCTCPAYTWCGTKTPGATMTHQSGSRNASRQRFCHKMSDKQETGWNSGNRVLWHTVDKGCSPSLQREPSLPASLKLVGAMGVETRQEWGQVVRTAWQGEGFLWVGWILVKDTPLVRLSSVMP